MQSFSAEFIKEFRSEFDNKLLVQSELNQFKLNEAKLQIDSQIK